MGSVFISHASEDKARLTPVLEGLLRRDVTLFVDHPELVNWSPAIRPRVRDMVRAIGNGRWRPIINDALEFCDIVAGAVSSGAMKPRAGLHDQRVVKDEFDIAQNLAKFVPFKIDNVDIQKDQFLALRNMRYFNLASAQDADECVDWIYAARQDALNRNTSNRYVYWTERRANACQLHQNGQLQGTVGLRGEQILLNYVPPVDDGPGFYISKWSAGLHTAAEVNAILNDCGPFGVDLPTSAELRHALWPEGCPLTESNPFGVTRDLQDVLHWVSNNGRPAMVDANGKPAPRNQEMAFLRLKF